MVIAASPSPSDPERDVPVPARAAACVPGIVPGPVVGIWICAVAVVDRQVDLLIVIIVVVVSQGEVVRVIRIGLVFILGQITARLDDCEQLRVRIA
jgi:hypothetical protein